MVKEKIENVLVILDYNCKHAVGWVVEVARFTVTLTPVGDKPMPTCLTDVPMSAEKKPVKVQSVKLEMDVLKDARIAASCRGESITAMLSTILRPVVAKMAREEMQKQLKQGGRG